MTEAKLVKLALIAILLTTVGAGFAQNSGAEIRTSEIRTPYWIMPLAEGYVVNKSGNIYNLQSANSRGAIQLSAFRRTSAISTGELEQLANSQVAGRAKIEEIANRSWSGFRASFVERGVEWVYWFVVVDRSLIFITFNAEEANDNSAAIHAVESMVNAIRAT